MNELHLETSPYLIQHASNPIFWKAWYEETLATAKKENKLILISIGYAACHWCHVMEHECFEDQEVADLMNAHFVAIKVDKEERPDVDAIYMKALQMMTGQGGWPLNVVCLPDGRPIWGATYVNKTNWMETLLQLAQLFQNNPGRIMEYAEKMKEGLNALGMVSHNTLSDEFPFENIHLHIEKWKKSFDLEFGGYTRAPKFMMPTNLDALQYYGYLYQDDAIINHVDLTLTKMAYGGLFDTVGGGFSRYSVDLKWHVPHFEKMLYDNAQLISVYADAYKRTHNPIFKSIIEKTISFVDEELTDSNGGFYASLDADSIDANQHLTEGAFYVWKKKELEIILKDDFLLFSEVFNINSFGYWEDDNYVLIQNESLAVIAKRNNLSVEKMASKKSAWEQQLYQIREARSKPRLDDKCLTSWNALMLKAYSNAYAALGAPSYLEAAEKNAQFLTQKLGAAEGRLWHSYKNNTAKIEGFLEDYAFTIEAFISLYQVTLHDEYLQIAKQLTDYCFEQFYDEQQQFFAFTPRNAAPLIAPHFEVEDNVIPAANSVMASNLHVLGLLFHNPYYEKIVRQMLHHITVKIDYVSAYSNWIKLWITVNRGKELAICGENAVIEVSKINRDYHPNIIVAGSTKDSSIPFLNHRFVPSKTLFYLCENKSCLTPETTYEAIQTKLIP
ncbi:thioredoxin domain-containing protein [Flavobacterium sp.]|jgi:uncharacterized protein YyaL (SSP411 family)|uniref:thioredoxin domain-containing protein n=1 Tax=Flavobacterium sp. TaxID=239 RepID=UPI0037BE9FFD